MRKYILSRLLLISIFALTISSCDDKEDPSSQITSFEKYPLIVETSAAVTEEENEEILTFDFALDDRQITDITIDVGVGTSSTATEGVDFELSTHQIELASFEGQDGFSVDIQVLQDFEIENEPETIYLTFTTTTPSGLVKEEVLLVTINDSGILPPPPSVEISLAWNSQVAFMGEAFDLGDSLDIDFYLVEASDPDVPVDAAASADSPEHFELDGEMPDGTYIILANFFNTPLFEHVTCTDELQGTNFECGGPYAVPLNITFTRGENEQTISYPVLTNTDSDVWFYVDGEETNPEDYFPVATIEVVDGQFTFYDIDDNEIGSLRKRTGNVSFSKLFKGKK